MFEWYFWDTVGFEDKEGDHESNLIALGKQYTVLRTGTALQCSGPDGNCQIWKISFLVILLYSKVDGRNV